MVDVLETFLAAEVRSFIEYREWSIKTPEGVEVFTRLGGRVIPTLCVDGERVFESVIPTLDDLYGALLPRARDPVQKQALEAAFDRARKDYG